MTKRFFYDNAMMMVELEGEYGRHRATMKGSEVKAYIEAHKDEEFSDEDFAGNQPDPEIANILETAWENFKANSSKYGNYYNAIDELLEDEPEKPAEPAKKVWTKEEIKNLVQTNDKVLYGALKKLYAEQTADEQYAGYTKDRNNAGFNSLDSKFLTSVAQFLAKKGFLTDNQKAVVRRKLVKYTAQLTRLANA